METETDIEQEIKYDAEALIDMVNDTLALTRSDVVPYYRSLMVKWMQYGQHLDIFPAVNAAIMERWSKSGLLYIKNAAWSELTPKAK